ncbi:MAG: IS110 family transposase [Candidatus Cloacimonetes bacterium]|nr:IS110 family transposase [Candidatus Cloacimonadota bacterium]
MPRCRNFPSSGTFYHRSIKGIGDVTAAIFTSGIGNIDDFEDKKNLNSYFGMIPSVRQSNNTIHYGRITKKGNRMVRAALVQCTLGMISHNPILKEFYQRIKRQKGSGKAIIATARKLLEFIYFTLSNNIVWEDSNAGVIQSMSNSSV